MEKNFILVKIDIDYCNYLRKFDNKVPYNSGNKKLRPFVGILFEVNNVTYFAPLTSPKPKHLKLKTKIDFIKIDNGKLGAINFNNMIPVTEKNILKIDLDKKISNKKEKYYNELLKKQLFWLNRNSSKLINNSKKLYNAYINKTLSKNIKNRCCNFTLLEEKCKEYNDKN